MRLLARLPGLCPAVRPSTVVKRPPVPRPPHDEAPAVEERPPGCGWFDSSHELQHGLRVTEHTQADAVLNQIPLSWWLGWELDAALGSTR